MGTAVLGQQLTGGHLGLQPSRAVVAAVAVALWGGVAAVAAWYLYRRRARA
jgi:hypothetical protein